MSERIGNILSRMVPLSDHDIDEILVEQKTTRRKFGAIAISMGLCRPEDVWKACSGQLGENIRKIDLATFGVDTQALAYLPIRLCHELGVIPVRVVDNDLIVAADERTLRRAAETLPSATSLKITFILADKDSIHEALAAYAPERMAS